MEHILASLQADVWIETYTLIALPEKFQRFMVDIIDQLLLHLIGAIVLYGLVDRITKSLLRFDRIVSSISAFQVDTLVFTELVGIASAVNAAVAVVAVENVASGSDHSL